MGFNQNMMPPQRFSSAQMERVILHNLLNFCFKQFLNNFKQFQFQSTYNTQVSNWKVTLKSKPLILNSQTSKFNSTLVGGGPTLINSNFTLKFAS